ncbi:MAG: hypothetical protein SFV51_20885 [Bryobacteraceae bacterium]|nr:hypothetical protein [Bryobacteraceae bacterium]
MKPPATEGARPPRIVWYQRLAEDLFAACQPDGAAALERVQAIFGASFTSEQLREQVLKRAPGSGPVSIEATRLVVARLYSFGTWADFESSFAQSLRTGSPALYRVDTEDNSITPLPPVSAEGWEEILEVIRDNRITTLRAAGQMTDAVLRDLSRLDSLTRLHLGGSRRVTGAGLRHLARMPRLELLELSCCDITGEDLAVVGQLLQLREFSLCHHGGVSDAGLANLKFCERLERVDLLGSSAGDGVIEALAGKPHLRHFRSGNLVTDAGLALLHRIPAFKTWQGGEPRYSLMGFDAEPNYLLLRGRITGAGVRNLAGLDGLFALNLDDASLTFTARELKPLAGLAHLGWLGFDATDETMGAIAALPHLRMLMCQDTSAGDAGFTALSRSRTIESIWGRRCYNLRNAGFAALSGMPSLRGLSVSCKNVDDAALSALPHFPSLTEFMPMDVSDDGFRHVGRCERLEALWCMYCRDTGDAATLHLAGLSRLKSYYAGQTGITDRSLQMLGRMESLERLTFWACANVTNGGVAALATLPRLRELNLESMPGVTREAMAAFPATVRVNLTP